MNKLTPEQLMLLNRKVVNKMVNENGNGNGNDEDVLRVKMDELREIAEIPYQTNDKFLYEHKRITEKAAVLGHLIAKRKPFCESNEETAVLALLTLLDVNCYRMIGLNREEIGKLSASLYEENTKETCTWIKEHLAEEIRYRVLDKT